MLRTFLRVTSAIAKRELFGYALAPVSYLLAALFLVVHGYGFFLICQSLSTGRAASSSVFGAFFGGTFLYWLLQLLVVTLSTMRLFAEDRQRGGLDQLLSIAAPEGALVLGKFAGAAAFYGLLWLPTLSYLWLLGRELGPGALLDTGPLVGGYLGTLLCGASGLALGLLASAVAPTVLVAAALTFTLQSLLLLAGLLADRYVGRPSLQALIDYLNLFGHLGELGRGVVDSRRIVYHASLTLLGLGGATLALRPRPGDRRGQRRALGLVAGLVAALVAANLLSSRHPLRLDLTRAAEHRLSPTLVALLGQPRPASQRLQLTLLQASSGDGSDEASELTRRLDETLTRAEQAAGGQLMLERLDPNRQPERSQLLGQRFHLESDELRQGVVIVESGGRSQLFFQRELGEALPALRSDGSQSSTLRYRGEALLYSAALAVLSGKTPTVCFTSGHGEAEPTSLAGSGLSELATAMGRENLRPTTLTDPSALGSLGASCDVVVVAGPARPLLPSEAAALGSYLDGGGRLLVLAGALLDSDLHSFLPTGLEELLRRRGVKLLDAVVLDPPQRLGDSLAFVVDGRYGDHPISSGLSGRRTLWPLARPLLPLAPLEPPTPSAAPLPVGTGHSGLDWRAWVLASTSPDGYGETDLGSLRDGSARFDPRLDIAGPVALAIAAQPRDPTLRGRLVVIGSTQLAWNDGLVLFNRDLLLLSLRWLAELTPPVAVPPHEATLLRLVLSAAQLQRLFVGIVVLLPLAVLLLGAVVSWRRRRPVDAGG